MLTAERVRINSGVFAAEQEAPMRMRFSMY